MKIILLGAPGAGKGTQADIIVKEMSLPHVASGDLFRHALRTVPSWASRRNPT